MAEIDGLIDRDYALRMLDALNRSHPGNQTRACTLWGVPVVILPGGFVEKHKASGELLCSARGQHEFAMTPNEPPCCRGCGWSAEVWRQTDG